MGFEIDSIAWETVALSVRIAFTAVLCSLPLGVALGWLLARRDFIGKTLVETVVNLPLALPPVVTGLLLLYTLGKRGWIGRYLWNWFGWEIALTWKAAVIAAAVMGLPLMVRSCRLAFASYDPRLFQVARSLGARPFDAFWSVSLPLARNGLIAGAVLAFARAMGEFGATLMFAGITPQTRTLATQIYVLNNQPGDVSEHQMWGLVVASVLISFAALAFSEYLQRRGHHHAAA